MTSPDHKTLTAALVPLALAAGEKIMDIYSRPFDVTVKADQSPVTEADELAETLIVQGLSNAFPAIDIIGEEMCAKGKVPKSSPQFFLVDALDGTKEFVAKRTEFTVNIALIVDNKPFYGLVYAPAANALYASLGADKAGFAEIEPKSGAALPAFTAITVRDWPAKDVRALASRSHSDADTDRFLERNGITERLSSGSSLKFCKLAAGQADVYPRFGPTMEWDTAAGHAVLLAAGGAVKTECGAPFLYGKEQTGFRNGPFIAANSAAFDKIVLETC